MKEKKFLLLPVYFLIIIFIIDKVFLLEFFQTSFLQKGNDVFYWHRKELFQRLIHDPEILQKKKKLLLVLGDSRAYPISLKLLPDNLKNEWKVYNFSAPQSVPMYALQYLERMIENGIIPDIVYFSLSPESFDDSKGFIYDPFLRLGMDAQFQKNYWNKVPLLDKYKYYIDYLFSFRRLQFDYKLFLERWKSGKLNQYKPEYNEDLLILRLGYGEYLAYAAVANVESKLQKDSLRIQSIYLNNFQLSPTQFEFVELVIKKANQVGSQVFIIWPKVYPGYRKAYENLRLKEIWWDKIVGLNTMYSFFPLNYNQEGKVVVSEPCNLFNDASHQSVYCFVGVLQDIFFLYNRNKNQ